jgi:protein-tyrosine phosphatase
LTASTPRRPAPSSQPSLSPVAECLRALARELRRLPDKVLHPLRRRVAWNTLRSRGLPRFTLVLCHGNICRSPYTAGALRRLLARGPCPRITSAGFAWPGRPPPPEAISAAAARGVDLSDHRSTLVMGHTVQAADLIVVMDAEQRRIICNGYGRKWRDVVVLGDLDPAPVETRAIFDPVQQPRAVFDETYARIDRCLHELVQVLAAGTAVG